MKVYLIATTTIGWGTPVHSFVVTATDEKSAMQKVEIANYARETQGNPLLFDPKNENLHCVKQLFKDEDVLVIN